MIAFLYLNNNNNLIESNLKKQADDIALIRGQRKVIRSRAKGQARVFQNNYRSKGESGNKERHRLR